MFREEGGGITKVTRKRAFISDNPDELRAEMLKHLQLMQKQYEEQYYGWVKGNIDQLIGDLTDPSDVTEYTKEI